MSDSADVKRTTVAAEQLRIAIDLLQQAEHALAVTIGAQRAAEAVGEALQSARIAAERTAIVQRAQARR